MTARRGAFGAACLLAASAIAHATGGAAAPLPTVVTVGGGPGGVATGFTVAPGRVVTVAHVLAGDAVAVRGADGKLRRAAVVRRDDALDLAVLAVGMPGVKAAIRRDDALPAVPAASGAALRLPLATRGPRVLVRRDGRQVAEPVRLRRRIDARVRTGAGALVGRRPALELEAPIRAGDSGAPLVGPDGRVIGIVFARSRDRPGIAYAADAAVLQRLLP